MQGEDSRDEFCISFWICFRLYQSRSLMQTYLTAMQVLVPTFCPRQTLPIIPTPSTCSKQILYSPTTFALTLLLIINKGIQNPLQLFRLIFYMENGSVVSIQDLQPDHEQQMKEVCKIIDHAKHTKFKYIDLNLLKDSLLQKNSNYSYLLRILEKFKPDNTSNILEINAMVQLAEMLQTCKMLNSPVLDQYLKRVVDWFSQRQSSGINNKLLALNTQRSKSTNRTQDKNTKRSTTIERPKTGVNKAPKSHKDRPVSVAYGGISHKYRPYSGTYTTASTKITKNVSTNQKTTYMEFQKQQSESDKSSKDNQSDFSFIDTKAKVYLHDTDQLQIQDEVYVPPRRGDFQHTKEGELLLYQITGDQKHRKQNNYVKSKIEAREIAELLQQYQRGKSRGDSQSSRRVQSAKMFKKLRPTTAIRRTQKQNQSGDASINQLLYSVQQPKSVLKERFVPQRPLSAVIKPWSRDVKHINKEPIEKYRQNCGFSLTKTVYNIPHYEQFNPLDSKHIDCHNIEAFDEIEKIKKLLVKKGDIPVASLMKALVYDDMTSNENVHLPSPQLLSNPFLKKKKKVARKKRL